MHDIEYNSLNKQAGVGGGDLDISLSINGRYPAFCQYAALDDRVFTKFRQHPIYRQILEHVSPQQGGAYLERIRQLAPQLLENPLYAELRRNDEVGAAELVTYPGLQPISPSTLRYMWVAAMIQEHFKTLDGMRLGEIGVGYGGQCRILQACHSLRSYRLIDIKPALALAQKYLDHYPLHTQLGYSTMNELSYDAEYDFVISNYAFSEIVRDFQQVYLDKVICRSRRGLMIMNLITPERYACFTPDELLERIPHHPHIIAENPGFHPPGSAPNCIVIWGSDG